MDLSSSYALWKGIEELESKQQMRLLDWQLQAREPIHRFSDLKAGDHLVRKNSVLGLIPYEHHFICIGSDCEGRPTIVDYSPLNKASPAPNTALLQLGIVRVMTLPHKKNFIKNEDELQAKGREVERVVWPEELRRFFVREVINWALTRIGEKSIYHLVKNNCETFVMWCLCGLKISLQVTAKTSLVSLWS